MRCVGCVWDLPAFIFSSPIPTSITCIIYVISFFYDVFTFHCNYKDSLERRQRDIGKMLKFLSRVRIGFNALDPRTASCMEFLAQCNARKSKESNPACQVVVKRRTDDHPPQITVTFVNGVQQVFDATSTSAQTIRNMVLEKGQQLETEQMFREAGEAWPVIIPEEELRQPVPNIKVSI